MLRLEPFRAEGTETLSTALWHLKKDKELCSLATQVANKICLKIDVNLLISRDTLPYSSVFIIPYECILLNLMSHFLRINIFLANIILHEILHFSP